MSSEPRYGLQMGMPETADVKVVPSAARRSRFGVCTFGSPAKPQAWPRCWSPNSQGLRGGNHLRVGQLAGPRQSSLVQLGQPGVAALEEGSPGGGARWPAGAPRLTRHPARSRRRRREARRRPARGRQDTPGSARRAPAPSAPGDVLDRSHAAYRLLPTFDFKRWERSTARKGASSCTNWRGWLR